MDVAPVATIIAPPAALPVFDDTWKARCKSCRHYRPGTITRTGATMRCVKADHKRSAGGLTSCGDARSEGGQCGPDARLWEARDAQ